MSKVNIMATVLAKNGLPQSEMIYNIDTESVESVESVEEYKEDYRVLITMQDNTKFVVKGEVDEVKDLLDFGG